MEKLANKIWHNKKFQDEYREVIHRATEAEIGNNRLQFINDEGLVKRMLETSLIFSSIDSMHFRESAYKIAVSIWKLLGTEDKENLKSIYELIFARIGNFVAVELLDKDVSVNNSMLPVMAWYEKNSMESNNTIVIKDEIMQLTDFQMKIWKKLKEGMSLSIAAPTSAGKSYIIKMYLLSELLKYKGRIYIYIVPTRALITQVADDLREVIRSYNIIDTDVITAPIDEVDHCENNRIFVMTPERARILNTKDKQNFNIVIIDEAQSIEDLQRGVILQDVIDDITTCEGVQYVFLAPFINNPESISMLFSDLKIVSFSEDESPVFQNILKVNSENNTVNISLLSEEGVIECETRQVNDIINNNEQRLAVIAREMGKKNNNIIYTTGAAKCERICEYLVQDNNYSSGQGLVDLSKFIREYIHKEYMLADFIEKGVAFHYGKLPSIIRKNIEELFKNEELKYIVCTSTLLYGVNVPAKNLFIMEPKKDTIPLTKAEFWNLIGRAGRLKKDFNGNIFLVNCDQEQELYMEGKKEIEVVPSMVNNVNYNYNELLRFMQDQDVASGKYSELENTFLKLYKYYKQGILEKQLKSLNRICAEQSRLTDESIEKIKSVLEEIDEKLSLDSSIILNNLSVSPYRQQEMFDYLVAKIKKKKVNDIIPMHPLKDGKQSYTSLLRLMKRIHNQFEHLPKENNQHIYFATIALKWMRGNHMSEMVTDALKRSSSKNVSSAIRSVMEDIDNKLRFKYVKYITCYNDILIAALIKTNNEDLISAIPNIPLYLELGASAETMINFMELGLSRTTSKVLLDHIKKQNMSLQEVKDYINSMDLENFIISPICIKEIRGVKTI